MTRGRIETAVVGFVVAAVLLATGVPPVLRTRQAHTAPRAPELPIEPPPRGASVSP